MTDANDDIEWKDGEIVNGKLEYEGSAYEGGIKTESIINMRESVQEKTRYLRHGIGTYTIPNGVQFGVQFKGGWKNDESHGKVTMTSADGSEEVRIFDEGVEITEDWIKDRYVGNNFDEIEMHVKYDKCQWADNSE